MEKDPNQGADVQPPAYYPSLPPSDPSYANPQPPQQVVQIVQMPNLGSESTRMTCPHCGAQISTRVKYSSGTMTHVAALLLCLFGCWPCVCVPYCVDSCMDADHECPNCDKFIGHYKR